MPVTLVVTDTQKKFSSRPRIAGRGARTPQMIQQPNTNEPHCNSSKWFAHINDTLIPAAQRLVAVGVLKAQGGIPDEQALIRDHNSPDDVILKDDETIDLAQGNVFYSVPKCDLPPRGHCTAPAKLAFSLDDRVEVTLRADQTGRTLRELFGLTVAARLFRDLESPNDEIITPDTPVRFADGPMFYSRRAGDGLTIVVNKQTFGEADGVKREMTGREIANLITDQPAEVKRLKAGKEIPVPLEEKVKLEGCEEFEVIRCNVKGGFEPRRIEFELTKLRGNGAEATFVSAPTGLVIYRGIRTANGYPHLTETDVLVLVPSAYPGSMLDGAYLPQGSPLLNRVAGSPQGVTVQADGRAWQLVSYHPHNGGGGPVWNPNRHGFHTYYTEILTWIQRAKN